MQEQINQLNANQTLERLSTTLAQPYLYGLRPYNLVPFEQHRLEAETFTAFLAMQQAAKKDGIELAICSAYRSFDRQLSIWNNKASGKRQLLDSANHPVDANTLTSDALIDTILIWSALPGASRHHWGTDIDVFDSSKIELSQLQLVDSEYQQNGPCFALSQWLEQHAHQFGFYRPFQQGLSGVSPEPWHLSYFPISGAYLEKFSPQDYATVLQASSIELKSALLPRLNAIIQHYVNFVAPPPIIAPQTT